MFIEMLLNFGVFRQENSKEKSKLPYPESETARKILLMPFKHSP